jgi:hypothetical protein
MQSLTQQPVSKQESYDFFSLNQGKNMICDFRDGYLTWTASEFGDHLTWTASEFREHSTWTTSEFRRTKIEPMRMGNNHGKWNRIIQTIKVHDRRSIILCDIFKKNYHGIGHRWWWE